MAGPTPSHAPVPWRVIFASIAAVGAVVFGIVAVWEIRKIVTWLLIATFFAVILDPAVSFFQRRLHLRRSLSVLLVFLLGIVAVAAMLYAFIRPLVDQANQFTESFPGYVADARAGRGPVGHLVKRYNLDTYLKKNDARLRRALQGAGKPALRIARSVVNGLVALVTILVLAFLMLMEGPRMLDGGLRALSPPHQARVRRVAADCSRALTGYMAGNLLISVIAGVVTYLGLWVFGVPFKGVLALWVGFADLIPMVGATLGAIVSVGVSFIHSIPAGIGMLVVYIVYQQFENHVLQVSIMARTVRLNPLVVLVSVLIGVELFGLLGALLAIPAAGVIQVIGKDIYETHHAPPVGAAEEPAGDGLEVPGPGDRRTRRGRAPDRPAQPRQEAS